MDLLHMWEEMVCLIHILASMGAMEHSEDRGE